MLAPQAFDADFARAAQELPAAPRLLVELGQLIRDPEVDARDVVALLRQDAALVSQIIRMANSAAYGRAEPAGSIEEAIAGIGFREVHRLVGAAAASQLADQRLDLYGIDGAKLRENSLLVAVLMEELAEVCDEEPRSCYTVGLLRSVGKMAIDRLSRESGLAPFPDSGERDLEVWESRIWGMSNCDIAERILLQWRLPHETVIAIKHHYHPSGKHNPVIHLLALAAGEAAARRGGLPGEEFLQYHSGENFEKAGLDADDFKRVCTRAERTFERLRSAIGG